MDNNPLEGLLHTLGQARSDGVFSADASPQPWKAARRQVIHMSARHFAWGRVAAPLAAAAALVAVVVGPSLWSTRAVPQMPQSHVAVSTHQPETIADAGPIATTAQAADCDFNGDGVVDGRDIQARSGTTGLKDRLPGTDLLMGRRAGDPEARCIP